MLAPDRCTTLRDLPSPDRRTARLADGLRAVQTLFDVTFSAVVLIPCFLLVAACLLVLNPILNPGPMFYRPERMGRDCRPFRLYKFRTMLPAAMRRGAAPTTRWRRSA
jgi:lipopolysaccharide/colanic/teichoic acid biosynthesis glycosyltransferase